MTNLLCSYLVLASILVVKLTPDSKMAFLLRMYFVSPIIDLINKGKSYHIFFLIFALAFAPVAFSVTMMAGFETLLLYVSHAALYSDIIFGIAISTAAIKLSFVRSFIERNFRSFFGRLR